MYYYTIYGMQVESELDLGFEQSLSDNKQDVYIRMNKPVETEEDFDQSLKIKYSETMVEVDIIGLASYRIIDGSVIEIRPKWKKGEPFNLDIQGIKLYLLGTGFSIIFFQREWFSLHGAAVSLGKECLAVVGESGAGKSSLMRGFIERGYKMLTDDVSLLRDDKKMFSIMPSYPSQKLWEDTLANFDMKGKHEEQIANRCEKYNKNISDNYCALPKPVKWVVCLEKYLGDEVKVSELDKSKSLEVLLNHTYRYELVSMFDLKKQQFLYMMKLLPHVRVLHVCRPEEGYTIEEQIDEILHYIRSTEK